MWRAGEIPADVLVQWEQQVAASVRAHAAEWRERTRSGRVHGVDVLAPREARELLDVVLLRECKEFAYPPPREGGYLADTADDVEPPERIVASALRVAHMLVRELPTLRAAALDDQAVIPAIAALLARDRSDYQRGPARYVRAPSTIIQVAALLTALLESDAARGSTRTRDRVLEAGVPQLLIARVPDNAGIDLLLAALSLLDALLRDRESGVLRALARVGVFAFAAHAAARAGALVLTQSEAALPWFDQTMRSALASGLDARDVALEPAGMGVHGGRVARDSAVAHALAEQAWQERRAERAISVARPVEHGDAPALTVMALDVCWAMLVAPHERELMSALHLSPACVSLARELCPRLERVAGCPGAEEVREAAARVRDAADLRNATARARCGARGCHRAERSGFAFTVRCACGSVAYCSEACRQAHWIGGHAMHCAAHTGARAIIAGTRSSAGGGGARRR